MARWRAPAEAAVARPAVGWSAEELEVWRAGRRAAGVCVCPVAEQLGRPCDVVDGSCFVEGL